MHLMEVSMENGGDGLGAGQQEVVKDEQELVRLSSCLQVGSPGQEE